MGAWSPINPSAINVGMPVDYVVSVVGGVAEAQSLTPGLSSYTGTDPAAVVQSAITALGTSGGTIMLSGSMTWGSVPAVPKGITGKLVICGSGRTVVTLSSAGPRFLDFNKTADYDTFQNISIDNLTIDCNNVGGRHHVVIGTYVNGTTIQRINIDELSVTRVRTINVPTDSTTTNHRLNLWVVVDMPSGSSSTSITNINVDQVRFDGGNMGIVLGASGTAGSSCTLDGFNIDRWRHTLGAVQSTNFSSSNVQIGSAAVVGRGTIKRGFGQYSGDVGIEIDQPTYVTVEDVTIEDSYNIAYYVTNLSNPTYANANEWVFERCRARRVSATAGCGWCVTMNSSIPLGSLTLNDCKWYRNTSDVVVSGEAVNFSNSVALSRLVLDKVTSTNESVNMTSGSTQTTVPFQLTCSNTQTIPCSMNISRCGVYYAGQRSGGGVFSVKGVLIQGNVDLDMDGLDLNIGVTGMSASSIIGVDLGLVATTLRGRMRGVKWLACSDDTAPRGVIVRGTGTLTIAPNDFFIEGCDFTALPAGAAEILFVATSNAANVFVERNVYRNGNTRPAPSTLAGLTTATGKAIGTGWPAIAQFVQGSGAGITAIDVSTDGGSHYTNLLTQASGAMPAGADIVIGPLTPDALIKVTFATTQPTINLIPVNP